MLSTPLERLFLAPDSLRPITHRADWERLFAEVPLPHFTQAWSYGEGKRAAGWKPERLAIESSRGPYAICQLLVRRIVGIPVATRINRGPLFLQRAAGNARRIAALRALAQHWRYGRRGLVFAAPDLPATEDSDAIMRAAGFFRRRAGGWASALVDLQPPLEAIRSGLSSKWRNQLNVSMKSGLEVRIGPMQWMLDRHAENMADKQFDGPSVRFVRAMIASSPDDFLVLQALLDGQPCAGLMLARFGAHAEYYLGWYGASSRKANAGNYLLWQAIIAAKAAGCRALDLGGYTGAETYGRFKRGLKGREYHLAGEWVSL